MTLGDKFKEEALQRKSSRKESVKEKLHRLKLQFRKSNNFMDSVEEFRREFSKEKQRMQVQPRGRRSDDMFITETTELVVQPKWRSDKKDKVNIKKIKNLKNEYYVN